MLTVLASTACLALAARSYNVSKASIHAVLSAPADIGGVGPMHIPTAWLPILARVGFIPARVVHDACTNIEAGTWILAYEAGQKRNRPSAPLTTLTFQKPEFDDFSRKDECVARAAHYYHIPVTLFSAVLRTEGGHVGEIHENDNGSYDMGPAQINSIWLPVLAKSGITRDMVINDRCLNIFIGAWILGQSLAGVSPENPGKFWQSVGDYNSHTPFWNRQYALKVWNNLR